MIKISLALRLALLLNLALLLTACGWQLRGYQQFQAQSLNKIESISLHNTANNRQFQAVLERQLKDLSIALESQADIKLTIHKEHNERRPLSFGSTGIPIQYQLIMTIQYNLIRPNKESIIERQLIARRQYDFDTGLIAAKYEEERQLLHEMRQELVNRIIANLHGQ